MHLSTSKRLTELRNELLSLHKFLLDRERADYEMIHGPVHSGQLLQLLLSDEQFAWLRAISGMAARIDEILDAAQPPPEAQAREIASEVRTLLVPSESGLPFQRKYYAALQSDPGAAAVHGELMRLTRAER
jgi:hypothetical protein